MPQDLQFAVVTFPAVPPAIRFTLLNAAMYWVRQHTRKRALERTLRSIGLVLHHTADDPEGMVHAVVEALTHAVPMEDRPRLVATMVGYVHIMREGDYVAVVKEELRKYRARLSKPLKGRSKRVVIRMNFERADDPEQTPEEYP